MEPGQEAPKLPEIYAYLGLAMFFSQALEGLLNQAIFVFVIFPANKSEIQEMVGRNSLGEWGKFLDSHDERLRRNTLGRLLGKLKEKKELSPDIEKFLQDALEQRNYVTHNFFKDIGATLYSEKGQDDAIFRLRRAGGVIKQAVDQFSPLIDAEAARYGYDTAYVEEHARRAIKDAVDER